MKPHALLAALLTHALTQAAPPPRQTPVPFLPDANAFEYDYSADVEALEAILAQATTPQPVMLPPRDPLEDTAQTPSRTPHNALSSDCETSAREIAKLNIMERILIALGPPFGEKLPEAPNSDTLATVPTPINITTEPCPYKYKRCSSQTYFPSCDIPRNTDSEIWPQRFNLFFNLSEDFNSKLDVINATLRLYKNNSLSLEWPKTLLIRAFVYTRSLTRRRNKIKLVADTQISSDYIGWVSLSVTEMVKRWKRKKNNHGLLITVIDVDDTQWDAPRIFVTMDCDPDTSPAPLNVAPTQSGGAALPPRKVNPGLVPLPFEVQTEDGQQYPALNVRLGSPDDEPEPALSTVPPVSSVPLNLSKNAPALQDDQNLYEYNYEADLEEEVDKEREVEGLDEVEASPVEDDTPVFHTLYNLHARASLNPMGRSTPYRDHMLYQRPGPPPLPQLPITTTTQLPPQETTTPTPPPTPTVPPFRMAQRRRGPPKHRKKNREGKRRG